MYKDFYQSNRNYKKNFAKLIDIEYQQRKRKEKDLKKKILQKGKAVIPMYYGDEHHQNQSQRNDAPAAVK